MKCVYIFAIIVLEKQDECMKTLETLIMKIYKKLLKIMTIKDNTVTLEVFLIEK